MKSYTDIEQSKVLAKILPLESADYYHATDAGIVIIAPYITYCGEERCVPAYKGAVPCWSLDALLNIFPANEYRSVSLCHGGWCEDKYISKWFCTYEIYEKGFKTIISDNPIDACYELILKLHKEKLLLL